MAGEAVAGLRTCTKCGHDKPLSEFSKNSKCSLGRLHQCKACCARRQRDEYRGRYCVDPEKRKEYYQRTSERAKERAAKRRAEKPREVAEGKRRHREENPELYREYGRRYIAANPEKIAESRRLARQKFRSNPKNRLSGAMAAGVRDALKGRKVKRTFEILGYSPEELMAHLEKHFLPGMTWENYGRNGWHVDHVIPLSAFNFETYEHVDFTRAWALSNLRPLWEPDNIRKHAKLSAPFQPSLCI